MWVVLAVRLILPFDFSISGHAVMTPSVSNILKKEEKIVDLPKGGQEDGEMKSESHASEPVFWGQNAEYKPAEKQIKSEVTAQSVPQTAAVQIKNTDLPDSLFWLASVFWAVGVILLFVWQAVCFLSFLYKINHSKVFIGRKENLSVYTSAVVSSPMLMGMIKPQILLPDREYTKEDLAFILEHEFAHYKRKDLWIRFLLVLARTLHWFNPFVVCMERQAIRDMELLCDSDVVKQFSKEEKKQYSAALLNCASSEKKKRTILCTSEFSKDVKTLKERFANIFSERKKRGTLAVVLGIMAVLAVSLFAASGKIEKGSKEISEESENLRRGEQNEKEAKREEELEEKRSMLLSLSEEEVANAAYGAVFPKIVYASDKRAVLYDYWGLLVYDFEERQIEQMLDLKALDLNHMQGENVTHVEVSSDGGKILLYNEQDTKERFIYDIEEKKLFYSTLDSFEENHYDGLSEVKGQNYAFTEMGNRVFLSTDSLWTEEGENYHTNDMQGLSLIVADKVWGGGEVYPLFWDYMKGTENKVEPRLKVSDLCRIVGKVCLYQDKDGWSYYLEEDEGKESALWGIADLFEPLLLTRYQEGKRQVLEDLIYQEAWIECPVLFAGGRILYKAARTADIVGIKEAMLISIAMDGSDRKTADSIMYGVFDGICEDDGWIYYSGWTNDVLPKPLCRISPDFSSGAQFVENIWGYLCGVKDGEVYYCTSQEKQRAGIWKKNLATGEERVSDKLGMTVESLKFFRVREDLFLKGELYDHECHGCQILYSYDEYENIYCISEPFE